MSIRSSLCLFSATPCQGAAARGPIAAPLAPPGVGHITVGVTGHRIRGDALQVPWRRAE